MADLEGAVPGARPPLRVKILSFWHTIFETEPPRESTPPMRWTPPYGKSWILHCYGTWLFFDFDSLSYFIRPKLYSTQLFSTEIFVWYLESVVLTYFLHWNLTYTYTCQLVVCDWTQFLWYQQWFSYVVVLRSLAPRWIHYVVGSQTVQFVRCLNVI